MTDSYRAFLEAKVNLDEGSGFAVDPAELNPLLKPISHLAVTWALAGGRRAIFKRFGLHKTVDQLEIMRLIGAHGPCMRLITLPLGVRQEFFSDAAEFFRGEHAIKLKFIRRIEEVEDDRTIYMTNTESVREGVLDVPALKLGAMSWDEADILRGFGGSKTFREGMAVFAGDDRRDLANPVQSDGVPFRYVATATPDPQEYIELLAYAAFLGIMSVSEAKTRFFKRDSQKADHLTLHEHKVREFWMWVSSWALFIQKPSDVGLSDEGYDLPPLDIRWHEIPTDHAAAGTEKDGQGRIFRNAALGLSDAAREKRDSLDGRIAKVMELRAEEPAAHRILWHDLEAEREALERAIPGIATVYGRQDIDAREELIIGFRNGTVAELGGKPSMLGAGGNFQKHCHWQIFVGIGFKFRDLLQSIHRLLRFGQQFPVRVDLIFTEAEREIRREIERRWKQHDEQVQIMADLIREFGLSHLSMTKALTQTIGSDREEASGQGWCLVKNDCVVETRRMQSDSVHMILTSIPFSNQYSYSPSFNDFGHTDNLEHFFRQMDFLTPELLRVLQPGRVCAVHVKDRITPGGVNGFGFQTVSRISDDCADHFEKHGFAFLGRKTIVTDVVRENNQTYRLGWTEQCKDGSRMGAGLPEYVLLFRKPPSDRSKGYADVPVVKEKKFLRHDDWVNPGGYSRGRWQFDAHGFMRSSGNRLLCAEDLVGLEQDQIFKLFRKHSLTTVYDFEQDVAIAEGLDKSGWLPSKFMLLQPQSWHPDVWTDITRMLTLNGAQSAAGREAHLCPLQFDICDRLISQFSMPGEEVFDPFAGIGSVPLRALKLKRRGHGCELKLEYWQDATWYLQQQEREASMPSLFDALETEEGEAA